MTFEEWWSQKDRVYTNEYSTFKSVSAEAWNHQQAEINKLKDMCQFYKVKYESAINQLHSKQEEE